MKSTRVLAFALLLFLPSIARAQINLAWNNCITQPSAADNIQYACDGSRNGTPYKLVMSFVNPSSLPAFVGIQGYMTIGLPGGDPGANLPLPDWWKLGLGQCRDGNLNFPTSLSGVGTGTTGVCRNPWAGANTGGGFQYNWPLGGSAQNKAQLLTAFARDTPLAITAGQQYVAGVFTFDTFGDIAGENGPGCPGCCQSMYIILDRLQLFQVAGSPGGDIITMTTPATRQYVWWQQSPQCPTPVTRTTWGSVKATYR